VKLQNNLQYVAVSNLDAATFQVTYQLKILTTALFSVTLLHRQLSVQKWVSLVLLTFGIALVQLPAHETPKEEGFFHKHFSFHTRAVSAHTPSHDIEGVNPTLGLVTVFASCMLSGAAGVYFEKVLKGSNATLWVRNVQLSFFSLFPALFIGVLWKDGSEVLSKVTISQCPRSDF
jgi:UDP-galactose transporter